MPKMPTDRYGRLSGKGTIYLGGSSPQPNCIIATEWRQSCDLSITAPVEASGQSGSSCWNFWAKSSTRCHPQATVLIRSSAHCSSAIRTDSTISGFAVLGHPAPRPGAAVAYCRNLNLRIERVMTDNGSCYRSKTFQAACKRLGLRQIFTRPYTPKTNGKAEGVNWGTCIGKQLSEAARARLPAFLEGRSGGRSLLHLPGQGRRGRSRDVARQAAHPRRADASLPPPSNGRTLHQPTSSSSTRSSAAALRSRGRRRARAGTQRLGRKQLPGANEARGERRKR
jgi:hypothetical protein